VAIFFVRTLWTIHANSVSREMLKERYKDKLEPRYEEPIHQVITKIFRGLSGKKVIMPSKDFVRYALRSMPSLRTANIKERLRKADKNML
jgi:hypothetical protein